MSYRRLLLVGLVVFVAALTVNWRTVTADDSLPTTYTSSAQTTSKHIARDFVPDGNLGKAAWRGAVWNQMGHDAYTGADYPGSATEVASLWTAKYAYFGYRCKYTTLNVYDSRDTSKDFWKLWERDVVEIFLNAHPEHMYQYYEFEVAPNNLWIDLAIDFNKKPFNDAKWNSGFEHATHVDANKHVWTCEIRIPVAAVNSGQPLEANAQWRVNFYRDDLPGDNDHRHAMAWSQISTRQHGFHSPWSFGLIRFVK